MPASVPATVQSPSAPRRPHTPAPSPAPRFGPGPVPAVLLALAVLLVLSPVALAGGAWVAPPGSGDVQVGFSRKQADTSWNAFGTAFANSGRFENHDFRYTYLSGELGLYDRLSLGFLVTYLDGREGPDGHLHRNAGWSDAWLGLRYALRRDELPMALNLTVRTPALYDISGPYSLELYDDEGNFLELSPEWRGLLKHDVTLSYAISSSLVNGGWWSLETGYTWREGAPADQVPVAAELGWPLPWYGLRVKGGVLWVQSLGNDSERRPDDRFGSRSSFNFNDASMARAVVSLLVPLGATGLQAEIGYGEWLWGRSARQYEEPFVAFSKRF